MFSPKMTTTCLIGVDVELSCSACTAMGANICVAHMSAATDVASAFCICITVPLVSAILYRHSAARKGIGCLHASRCDGSVTVRRKNRERTRRSLPCGLAKLPSHVPLQGPRYVDNVPLTT